MNSFCSKKNPCLMEIGPNILLHYILHYKMMGKANGYTKFLYIDADKPSFWIIGHGEDISSAFAVFRGEAELGKTRLHQSSVCLPFGKMVSWPWSWNMTTL